MPTVSFSPAEWHIINESLTAYRRLEERWEQTTEDENWDESGALETLMQSEANSVVDIMLHVRTQQFSEGVPNAPH